MNRASASALVLAALWPGLWPATASAQEGPSFDCRDAGTRTEIAICASPGLSRLELRMYDTYVELADRIGAREARRIADELLARRQACEGDPDCIAERLLVSTEIFEQRGRSATELAGLAEPEPVPIPTPEPAPIPEIQLETPQRDRSLAAQGPLLLDAAPIPPSRPARGRDIAQAEPRIEIAPGDLGQTIAGAELASSDTATPSAMAPFDTPLSWAFMDLDREERARLQANLQDADLLEGPAEGTWTRGTLVAIEAFLATPEGQSFDASTESGAALALDFLGSDAYGAARGETSEGDLLDSTEW